MAAVGDIWKFTTSWSDGESHSHYLLFLKEDTKENLFYDIEGGERMVLDRAHCFKELVSTGGDDGLTSYWDWEYVA